MKEIINGLSVFLEGNSKNKSIIFLHGFPYDHTMWKAQINELSEKYFVLLMIFADLVNLPLMMDNIQWNLC